MSDPGHKDTYKSAVAVKPYESVTKVKEFIKLVEESKVPAWMNLVPEMTEGSDYCIQHGDVEKIPRPALKRNSVPKTLICHDYMGGYLDDRFVNANLDDGTNLYAFKQWCMIDTFVYFSHNLVTVPPPCYISAAHAHGVSILGTLITEGPSGLIACKEFLKDDGADFAKDLATISRLHKFDGYLINIENSLTEEDVLKMINFLRYLRMHLPDKSQIIWYDSVIDNGTLKWQNELNNKNYGFFNVCDGIFLNYVYKLEQLEASSLLAGHRKHDVYVGVDVFGRGCPGSGFSSSDALRMAREFDMSVAIFAPAWTKEVVPGDAYKNDYMFWSSLGKYLYAHGIRDTRKSKFIISGDARNASSDMSTNLYPLTMPSIDPDEERKILRAFQRDLGNWKQFYSRLPSPVVEIRQTSVGYNHIYIDKSAKFEYRFIPLMLFETVLHKGLQIHVSFLKTSNSPDVVAFYVILENSNNQRKELYKMQLRLANVSTESLPGLTGTMLEFGVEMPPSASLAIKTITIVTDSNE